MPDSAMEWWQRRRAGHIHAPYRMVRVTSSRFRRHPTTPPRTVSVLWVQGAHACVHCNVRRVYLRNKVTRDTCKTELFIFLQWSNGQSGKIKKFVLHGSDFALEKACVSQSERGEPCRGALSQYLVIAPFRAKTSSRRLCIEGMRFSADG